MPCRSDWSLRAGVIAAALLCLLPVAPAETAETAEAGASTGIAPLLRRFCVDCHSDDHAEARINLQELLRHQDPGRGFRTWENVIRVVSAGKMPPAESDQPAPSARKSLVTSIRGMLDRYIREHAGDPGRVVMRRLTSGEYRYTIEDLTGLQLPFENLLSGDAVGGEGFTNVGDVQFMQSSNIEQYLESAQRVAGHAVIGAGPLSFYDEPGRNGMEFAAMHRIRQIYRQHGFRAGAGEGAEEFGLDRYRRAFLTAWQFRHRARLGQPQATLISLARAAHLEPGFVQHVWKVLHSPDVAFPTSLVVKAWHDLPAPPAGNSPVADEFRKRVRSQCTSIEKLLRDWQSRMGTEGDDERAPVLTAGPVAGTTSHRFVVRIDWQTDNRAIPVRFSVLPAVESLQHSPVILWKNATIRFRNDVDPWSTRRPLREFMTEASASRLQFGSHPRAGQIEPLSFALTAPQVRDITIRLPESAEIALLEVDVELESRPGDDLAVRSFVSDGQPPPEGRNRPRGNSVLLVDRSSSDFEQWQAGVRQLARLFPNVSHREPAPSDRDPIPAPFDNTYNSPERNLFHYRVKYHRDDSFLVKHLLDETARRRLDEAWFDLLWASDYHQNKLVMLADRYGVKLQDREVADLDAAFLSEVPAATRGYFEQLLTSYAAVREAMQAAEVQHIDDCVSFAGRAWRRPLSEDQRKRLRQFYQHLRRNRDQDHAAAIRVLLARILVSPDFLYRVEPPGGDNEVVPLTNWQLANRLSYFLWSSLPDAELRRAAREGELTEPDQLARQARRMLRDRRAGRLAREFFGQWFGFYQFERHRGVDPGRFPEFTPSLQVAMRGEADAFFEHIIREDRPVGEILAADYTFLNRELARHYGIKPPQPLDDRLQRVEAVSEYRRGGLLGMGAILTTTSAPLRTSAVKRGDWILRRVLGTPVPPPPPDVGSIPAEDVAADGLTIREKLEAHRSDPSCVNCHTRMDPLGFALEQFDPIGRWRSTYRDGQKIDASGILEDGTEIDGPGSLRSYLQRNADDFYHTLSTRLIGYALGRAELASDCPLAEAMVAALSDDGRFSSVVEQIVRSRQFRYQRRLHPKTEPAAERGTTSTDSELPIDRPAPGREQKR